jgi:DNA-binding NarL/FixJ family response regulator
MIHVVIADDQQLVRSGFALILNSVADIEVVAEAGDGVEALAAVRRSRPDIVLMDLRMPHMDGVEALQHLSNGVDTKALPVLVLTTFDDDQEVRRALQAGARGYLLKDITPDDLISAVRNLAEGQRDDILLGHSITKGSSRASSAKAQPLPQRPRRQAHRGPRSPAVSATCWAPSPTAVEREIARSST